MSRPILLALSFLIFVSFGGLKAKGQSVPNSAAAAATSGASEDDDGAGEALPSDEPIEMALGELQSAFKAANSGDTSAQPTGHTELEKFTKQYLESKNTCVNLHQGAAYACLEFLSKHMIDGAAALNSVAALVGGLAVKDTCSKFSNAMDLASKSLTAYTAACGAAKLGCGGSCGSALKGIDGIIKTAETAKLNCKPNQLPPPAYATALAKCNALNASYDASVKSLKEESESEHNKNNKISVAGKVSLCTEKYTQLAISAVAGIGALAKSIMQGNDCEKKSSGDSSKLAANKLNVDQCADPKNANMPDCICLKNPRTPGCANTFQKSGEGHASRLTAGGMGPGGANQNGGGLGGLDGSSGIPPIEHGAFNGGDGGGFPGAPSGGGNAGLGGGGAGGGGGSGSGSDSGGGGLDLDKYGGGYGGGGGGAGRNGSGYASGYGSGKYRAYLPGGAKDPNRGLAGQQAWTNEVTGQGGKSNWEKVKERYHDNKSTLLNN